MNTSFLMRSLLVFGVIVSTQAGQSFAQVYKCNGKWTSTPCSGEAEQVIGDANPDTGASRNQGGNPSSFGMQQQIAVDPNDSQGFEIDDPATPPPPPTAAQTDSVPYADRLSAIRQFEKINRGFAAKNGIVLTKPELTTIKTTCENRSRPFKECQDLISAASTKLSELNLKKEENDLEAERNGIERLKVERRR